MKEHLSSSADVHDKEELGAALERPVKLHDEGMVQLLHDVPFVDNRFDFVLSEQFVLLHDLHGIEPACVLLPDKDDSAEGSSANHLDLFKVVSACFVS